MITAIPVTDKLQLARFLSGVDANGRRIAPSFRSVLFLLVDCAASRHWSSDRIAAACGVSVRTVGRALAYWRACGVVALRRQQRLTAVKTVNVDAALQCAKEGVTLARNICAVARSRARVFVRTFLADSDHRSLDRGLWKEPGAPTASLLKVLKRQWGRSSP